MKNLTLGIIWKKRYPFPWHYHLKTAKEGHGFLSSISSKSYHTLEKFDSIRSYSAQYPLSKMISNFFELYSSQLHYSRKEFGWRFVSYNATAFFSLVKRTGWCCPDSKQSPGLPPSTDLICLLLTHIPLLTPAATDQNTHKEFWLICFFFSVVLIFTLFSVLHLLFLFVKLKHFGMVCVGVGWDEMPSNRAAFFSLFSSIALVSHPGAGQNHWPGEEL